MQILFYLGQLQRWSKSNTDEEAGDLYTAAVELYMNLFKLCWQIELWEIDNLLKKYWTMSNTKIGRR